jgi:hypothetical protein
MNYDKFELLNNKLTLFFETFSEMICSRCVENKDFYHHNGIFNEFIKSKKNINTYIDSYFNDFEHGFFHGIMTCFIAYLIMDCDNKIDEHDKIFSSCLLHDFLKANNYSQEEHDKLLVEYFDNLMDQTYIHSNPSFNDEHNILILSDRIELRRYNDYNEWVDDRFYKIYDFIGLEKKLYIDIFYLKMRPALLYLYKNQNQIFIRHGIETPTIEIDTFYPKNNTYLSIANGYPIEHDEIPFCKSLNSFEIHNQYGHCSNHGIKSHWNSIKGLITHDDFLNNGGKIIDSKERDHLYASSNIELKNWLFMYQQNNKDSIIFKTNIEILLNNKTNGLISQKNVYLFFKLTKLLKERFVLLNKVL